MRASDLARYILQAGAFGASGDAEAVKARIALLGLNARVESAVNKGKTVYRVRLGPYGTATELASPKAKIASGRTEEHTSELQSLMRTSYDVFCLNNKKQKQQKTERQ